MKKRVPYSRISSTSFPAGLDIETRRYLEPISQALQKAQHQTGRLRFYDYLGAVYRTYKQWQHLGISKKMTRHLVEHYGTPSRKGTGTIRTLIDATFPTLDSKQKSRWSRALEFAALTKTPPENLPRLFKDHGIYGCARLAAKQEPKKDVVRNDWL